MAEITVHAAAATRTPSGVLSERSSPERIPLCGGNGQLPGLGRLVPRRGRCLATGVAVVSPTNPFYSALALIGNLASLAVSYLLLAAEFLAAAQVLVYAGAVMVMFLFVVAYLGGKADAPWAGGPLLLRTPRSSRPPRCSLRSSSCSASPGATAPEEACRGRLLREPAAIGGLFLTDHLLAFEITSIVLLVAAVGGVVLGTAQERER